MNVCPLQIKIHCKTSIMSYVSQTENGNDCQY